MMCTGRGRWWRSRVLALAAVGLTSCGGDDAPTPATGEATQVSCAEHNPLRNAYFGDLHVHTTFSFDAHGFDVRTTPAQAYRFAQGEPIALPPLDAAGNGTRMVRLQRPLDFAAVTDHSEFLGEVETCSTPGSAEYDSATCQNYRIGGNDPVSRFGIALTNSRPRRFNEICGADGQACLMRANTVWERIIDAAEAANDSGPRCAFTTFVAYEYSGTTGSSTLHRNVIFRNSHVPFPTSYFEQPTKEGLWGQLQTTCLDAGSGCDVIAIPHNSNESNGKTFRVEYSTGSTLDEQRAQAEFRAAIEPVAEIYQHKGDSECMNGVSGVIGAPDEQCDFEKRRKPPFPDCGEGIGQFGVGGGGCVSRRDFVRGALLNGLLEAERVGANPLRLGIIASTDTHNGTPGNADENTFGGHRGTDDDTPAKQLGTGTLTPGGIIFSPGGLAGIWAEENSRDSLFAALRRREVFGTSGPRITVRFFGGWNFPAGFCGDPKLIEKAYAQGVPMGGTLAQPPAGASAPMFVVAALRDPGLSNRPGTLLQRLQVIKGWIADGQPHQQVFDVAGDGNNGASVDPDTCTPQGPGAESLCTVWTDPSFDSTQNAFYYVRVLENPTCRWNVYTCAALAPDQRPSSCTDPSVAKTIQERAWTSPIWYER